MAAEPVQVWFRPAEAAAMLGKSEPTVRRWCKDGLIPAQKLGATWHISRATIEQLAGRPLGAPSAGEVESAAQRDADIRELRRLAAAMNTILARI